MTGWIKSVLWIQVCQECADYGRFGDDLVFKQAITELDGRDKAAWIDL